jgi:hypothetical protein
MSGRHLLIALLVSAVPMARGSRGESPEKPSPEENILQKARVPADGDGLLAFFRGRTLGDAERKRIEELIRRLAGDDFDDREAAARELRKVGGRAAPQLRAAAHAKDAEAAHRAEKLLKEIDPLPPLPAVAAARLLARRGSADAAPVLLAYLPCADDGAVEDEAFAALLALTSGGGKADRALLAALDDPQPMRRAAAAYVLGREGDKDQREAVRKRLEDADAQVRWQAASALLAAHDRAAVPALIALLADGPFDPAWRAEEALRRLAGDDAPKAALDDSPEGRSKCRGAWAAWRKEKGDGFDVTQYKDPERLLGYTLGVEFNTGRVWECDLDGSIRWQIKDLPGPMDAQVLANGHVLIAEANSHRVTERDLKGAVLWEQSIEEDQIRKTLGEPNSCQRLPNGNTFVATPKALMELGPAGKTVYFLQTVHRYANAAGKAPNGRIYYIEEGGIARIESQEKLQGVDWLHLPWDSTPQLDRVEHYVGLADLPGGRFLVADSKKGCVLEVEADGRAVWQADVSGACGVQRLPNGHTLVSFNHKVIELNADGHEVWATDAEGYVRRAYRR